MTEPFDQRNALWLRIITPERAQLESSAHWVQVPTPNGLLGVWPQHAPLISAVSPGEIEYEAQDGVHREWTPGGLLHIHHGQVLILTGSREQMASATAGGAQAWEESVDEISDVLGELEPPEAVSPGEAASQPGVDQSEGAAA